MAIIDPALLALIDPALLALIGGQRPEEPDSDNDDTSSFRQGPTTKDSEGTSRLRKTEPAAPQVPPVLSDGGDDGSDVDTLTTTRNLASPTGVVPQFSSLLLANSEGTPFVSTAAVAGSCPVQIGHEVQVLLAVYVADFQADPDATLNEIARVLGEMEGAEEGFTLQALQLIAAGAVPKATSEQRAAALLLATAQYQGQPLFVQVSHEGTYYPRLRGRRAAAWIQAYQALTQGTVTRGPDQQALMRAGLTEQQALLVLKYYGTEIDGHIVLTLEEFCNLLDDGHVVLEYPEGKGPKKPVRLRAQSAFLKTGGRCTPAKAAAQLAEAWPSDGPSSVPPNVFEQMLLHPARDKGLYKLLRDGSGNVNRDDVLAAIEDGLATVQKGKLVLTPIGRAVCRLMALADTDDDGLITTKELAKAVGLSEEEAAVIIKLFGDPNEPDTLCPSELARVFDEGVLQTLDSHVEQPTFALSRFALLLAQLGRQHEPSSDAEISTEELRPLLTPEAFAHIQSLAQSTSQQVSYQTLRSLLDTGALVLGPHGRWTLPRSSGRRV